MPDFDLVNIAGASGTYNGVLTALSSKTVTVRMIDGLNMSYEADKTVWGDGTHLKYTIKIVNNAAHDYVAPTIATDAFATTICTIVADSVTLNGAAVDPSDYSFVDGVFSIAVPDVEVGQTTTVTFQMQKVVTP